MLQVSQLKKGFSYQQSELGKDLIDNYRIRNWARSAHRPHKPINHEIVDM